MSGQVWGTQAPEGATQASQTGVPWCNLKKKDTEAIYTHSYLKKSIMFHIYKQIEKNHSDTLDVFDMCEKPNMFVWIIEPCSREISEACLG